MPCPARRSVLSARSLSAFKRLVVRGDGAAASGSSSRPGGYNEEIVTRVESGCGWARGHRDLAYSGVTVFKQSRAGPGGVSVPNAGRLKAQHGMMWHVPLAHRPRTTAHHDPPWATGGLTSSNIPSYSCTFFT